MAQALHFKNARVWWHESAHTGQAETRDFATRGDLILDTPAPGARVVDLRGYTIMPGLVNAHDHLELNHYPRSRFRQRYDNAHQWGDEFDTMLDRPPFAALRAFSLEARLAVGGIKNLLSGATTVAHHNPPHRALFRPRYPVRVLEKYGWSHSLHFETEAQVRLSYRGTPARVPWFIHLAEGTDDVAVSEFARLQALGCAGENTVLIHGVGVRPADVERAARAVRGLVWCPSTNRFLLGQTADAASWRHAGALVAIGSDSRLTADGDLLDELRAARAMSGLDDATLVRMVTADAARLIGLDNVGMLRAGARADFIAIHSADDDAAALVRARRADLALVVVGGVPMIGDPAVMAKFPDLPVARATLDGVPKLIWRDLARRLVNYELAEPRLVIENSRAGTPGSPGVLWRRGGL